MSAAYRAKRRYSAFSEAKNQEASGQSPRDRLFFGLIKRLPVLCLSRHTMQAEVRLIISRELGHEREQITSNYGESRDTGRGFGVRALTWAAASISDIPAGRGPILNHVEIQTQLHRDHCSLGRSG